MTTAKTEIIIHDNTIGKVWQIKSDKLCFDRKTLHDYLRLVVQQSHGRKTLAYIAATHLATSKNRATLVRANKTLCNVRTNVRAFNCDDFDRNWSHLNIVHVHYFDAT